MKVGGLFSLLKKYLDEYTDSESARTLTVLFFKRRDWVLTDMDKMPKEGVTK